MISQHSKDQAEEQGIIGPYIEGVDFFVEVDIFVNNVWTMMTWCV